MADESDFLELLIASERVETWINTIKDSSNTSRRVQAIRELATAVEAKEAYAEEARNAGAVPVLTRLLKTTAEDEPLLDLISDIIAACSGPGATSAKVRQMRTFWYNGVPVVIKEGALGDGVGAKIWTVAHTLCRELAAYPEIVKGQEVLEIGSGCGACGILAGKIGATKVYLTDYLEGILNNLRTCVHLNALAVDNPDCELHSAKGIEALDPEDASDCSDFDAFLDEVAAAPAQIEDELPWDKSNLHVRFLDWSDSETYLRNKKIAWGQPAISEENPNCGTYFGCTEEGTAFGGNVSARNQESRGSLGASSNYKLAPSIDDHQQFPVILGTDILYEWPMAEMVTSVLKHRLSASGRALLCCAVREQAMFDAFYDLLHTVGFKVGVSPVKPKMDDGGILGNERDYEGGFVLIAIEHAKFPAASWHRNDLFQAS